MMKLKIARGVIGGWCFPAPSQTARDAALTNTRDWKGEYRGGGG
jgi:hypothetical protein